MGHFPLDLFIGVHNEGIYWPWPMSHLGDSVLEELEEKERGGNPRKECKQNTLRTSNLPHLTRRCCSNPTVLLLCKGGLGTRSSWRMEFNSAWRPGLTQIRNGKTRFWLLFLPLHVLLLSGLNLPVLLHALPLASCSVSPSLIYSGYLSLTLSPPGGPHLLQSFP